MHAFTHTHTHTHTHFRILSHTTRECEGSGGPASSTGYTGMLCVCVVCVECEIVWLCLAASVYVSMCVCVVLRTYINSFPSPPSTHTLTHTRTAPLSHSDQHLHLPVRAPQEDRQQEICAGVCLPDRHHGYLPRRVYECIRY
jgi:hypothetical protein